MKKETKISLTILLLGGIVMTAYWFYPMKKALSNKDNASMSEKIILPSNHQDVYYSLPEVQSYRQELQQLIHSGKAIIPLQNNELNTETKIVQSLLLENEDFIGDSVQAQNYLHSDMMRIVPTLLSTLNTKAQKLCKNSTCYTAEKYNFVRNSTTRAVVSLEREKIVSIQYFENMQPDISLRLRKIAQAIALNAPEIKSELGEKPRLKDISMANVRGALQESPCENSRHLCVAPTFADHQKERALWAIVDLTELKLSAAKWVGLGKTTTPASISERSLQNQYIMENFCQKNTQLNKNGWKLIYRLTGSDGLEIRAVSFHGKPVLTSAKIVDWHVSYQQLGSYNSDNDTYIAGRQVEFVQSNEKSYMFGYNDAMGCPMFSTSVVLPFNAPQIKNFKNGFSLTQDFRNPKWPMACNYRYQNRYEFYDDGSFRVLAINIGRGCGKNAIYRPVMRIDMAVSDQEVFYGKKENWRKWPVEKGEKVTAKGMAYKITSKQDEDFGYFIQANYGQFKDDSRGDNANLFVTKFNSQEGDQDLLTLGSCCDFQDDGIGRFLKDKESIDGENLVLWYVPRIHNDARVGSEYCWADTQLSNTGDIQIKQWPCVVGPKFIPITKS